MIRTKQMVTGLILTLLLSPALGFSSPYIMNATPSITPANTGATMDITGTGFGALDDRVYFPGSDGGWVNPVSLITGGIRVRVPRACSGDFYVVDYPQMYWSNAFNHDITFSYAGYKWQYGSFTWYLNVNGAPGCTFTSVKTALVNGYNAWTCASDATATYGGTTTTAVSINDGINCRYWSTTGWEDDQSILAYAGNWYINDRMVDSDVRFNAQFYDWTTTGVADHHDVGHIGTHEEGHTLGLLDLYGTADIGKTMYGYGAAGETHNRTLHSTDAMGVEYMYPHSRANFTYTTPSGWAGPLIPRNTSDASNTYCPLPPALNGNAATYLNVTAMNNGFDCAAPSGNIDIYVDGVVELSPAWSGLWNPDVVLSFTNNPFTIRGGRHTVMSLLDPEFSTLETNEYDNVQENQFVWSPLVLEDGEYAYRATPPDRGFFTYVNCDGFEFSTGGKWWAVVGAISGNAVDDYDLRLHNQVPTSTSGFGAQVASSTMSGQTVDFVLANGNNGGGADITRWVGLNKWDEGSSFALVELCQSVELLQAPVTSVNHNMPNLHFVKMHEVYFAQTGEWALILNNEGLGTDLDFALYDKNGTHFSRQDYAAMGSGHGNGEDEYIYFNVEDPGYYGLVVFKSLASQRNNLATYSLDIRLSPPNLTYTTPTGWDYPVVPRNDAAASAGNVHVSSTLNGNAYNTRFSMAGINNGYNPTTSGNTKFYVDEVFYTNLNFGAIAVEQTFVNYNYGPTLINGGRHTAEWRLDPNNEVIELYEDDNIYQRQFIWSPLALSNGVPVNRGAPPVRGSGAFYNGDGCALTPISQFAWVTATCPLVAADDYFVSVYNDYSGPQSGFSQLFKSGHRGPGDSAYVAGAYSTAGATRYPAILRYSGGSNHVIIDNASSSGHMGSELPAVWNGVSLAANHLVEIFEVYLTAGETYVMDMVNSQGNADLDVFAHQPTQLAMGSLDDEFFWTAHGAGQGEGGQFTPSESGYYVFIVAKNHYSDVPLAAAFNFSISRSATPVGDEESSLPTVVTLLGNHPNPFNPQTEISFTIPARGSFVRLDIYDLSGRRVRTLANQEMPAGVHRLVWDGRNNNGETQTSGTYFYQLKAGSFAQTGKMTLLK